jgi:hypothetical protein
MLHGTILLPSQNELKARAFLKDFIDTNSERCDRSFIQIEEHGFKDFLPTNALFIKT